MIANVSAHRRANAFAQALEEQTSGDRTAEQPGASAANAEYGIPSAKGRGKLLDLAGGLGDLPKPQLDPEVRTVQRAQLVAAMEAMLAESSVSGGPQVPEQRSRKGAHRASPLRRLQPRSRWSKGLAVGGLTVGVAAGAFSGVAAASSDALPGDSLYGFKRGMEDLKRNLADDGSDRGEVYLDQAATRMHEARRLMERGRSGDLDSESLGEVRRALSGMRYDASEGHRLLSAAYERDGSLGPIQALESFSKSHRESWRELRDRLPAQLTDVSDEVTSVFDAMDEEVGPLKSLLPSARGKEDRSGEGSRSSSGASGSEHTSGEPEASASTPSERRSGGESKPRPSASRHGDPGLIDGAGDLLEPQKSGSPTPSGQSGGSGKSPKPDVTLPPLLPGLLPGLGIEGQDAN
ncbi:DUF5667 domain-containing protein [Streptomyces sp. NPDC004647]|uniref:DUF5667 domain-containing protein n=1 Tax=Streptomyces sp. NPDC004647 TaxID=3154671 RepID=UPI0033AFEF4F